MTCGIFGDSIALMVAAYAHGCVVDARVGIGSAAIISRVRPADVVVISAGSNDPHNPRLAANLRAMRERAGNSKITWIIPSAAVAPAGSVVRAAAAAHGDRAVEFTPGRGGLQARVHPACPKCLAKEIFGQ